ncbi:MAG: Coenzyme F420 hydrogenase/dehydrogenase, beta subunit C-terminal domain [Thermoleophilia bacterium]
MVGPDHTVARVFSAGLCMQCGTCAGLCPRGSITLAWRSRSGFDLHVDGSACNQCGTCLEVCPGEGLDFTGGAWWRSRNGGAPSADFLGPWRGLWFGWAADEATRFKGASGGAATAIVQGALATGVIDAALLVGMGGAPPGASALAATPVVARSADQIAACRGSKYSAVALNTALRRVLDEPGRYALVGLPCHIQGLRLAQRHHPSLRERVVLALGIFCGLTAVPRATEIAARRAGVDPTELAEVSYRGPDWPGGMRLVTRSGGVREVPYPDYFDRWVDVWVPSRCRLCPDALAELADISVGDAWLDRFTGTPGVSDVIARTDIGAALLDELGPEWLTLTEAGPGEMVRSQREARRVKRNVYRGRRWLRALAGRPVPEYPGIPSTASWADRVAGLRDAFRERAFQALGDLRYR